MSLVEDNPTIKRSLRRKIEIPAMSDADDLMMNRYHVYRGLSPDTSNRLEMKIKTLEENLESEKESKISVEQEIQLLVEELQLQNEMNEDLTKKLNEQLSLARLKDQEFSKLKREYESLLQEKEGMEMLMKKKMQDTLGDFSEQLEAANRQKNRVESDRRRMLVEMSELNSNLESTNAQKRQLESKLESSEKENKRLKLESEEKSRQIQEIQSLKAKMASDFAALQLNVRNLENSKEEFFREKSKLGQEVENLKLALEESEMQKPPMTSAIGVLRNDLQTAKNELEDEQQTKQLLQSNILKLQNDISALKVSFDNDLSMQIQDAEGQRKKLMGKIAETEGNLNQLAKRNAKLEKDNLRLNADIKELCNDLALHKAQIAEILKKLKSQESQNSEQRLKIDQLNINLDSKIESESKLQGEISKLKLVLKTLSDDLEKSNRDNKLFNDSIKELKEENKDLKKQVQDSANLKTMVDKELLVLASKIGEAEDKLSNKENHIFLLSNELKSAKDEMNDKIRIKQQEIESLKSNLDKGGEEALRRLEEEKVRHKTELNRLRKGFEIENYQLKSDLEQAGRQNAELNRSNRSLQSRIKELESIVLNLEGSAEDLRAQLGVSERKRSSLEIQLDQMQSKIQSMELAKRNLDLSYQETLQQVEGLTSQLSSTLNELKRSESELLSLKMLTDEFANTKRELEEIIERQKNEVERLNEGLKFEAERSTQSEKMVQEMERKLREMKMVMEELEEKNFKEERKIALKIGEKLQSLQTELEGEQKKIKNLTAENRKLNKQLQELTFDRDLEMKEREDKERALEGANNAITKLKKQLIESEDVIGLVTSKYKRLQHQLQEATEHKEQLETASVLHGSRASSYNSVSLPSGTRLSISRAIRYEE